MDGKKVAIMMLKVDLQCEKCYKKVKRVLFKFPQIQDQVFDEKTNTVTIKVVCCSPEKIKQEIWGKGGESIRSIEIIPPPKPKEPEKPKTPAPPTTTTTVTTKTTTETPPARAKAAEPQKQDKPTVTFVDQRPTPAPGFPQPAYPYPVGMYCREGHEGLGNYGPTKCYCGYHGRPVYDSWGVGGGDSYGGNRCDYFSDENPNAACRIM